jgi:hypothetical protein
MHIITDTNGLPLTVEIHAASEYDGKAAFRVIETLNHRFERMKKFMPIALIAENLLKM